LRWFEHCEKNLKGLFVRVAYKVSSVARRIKAGGYIVAVVV
jgi:hypothetical protein